MQEVRDANSDDQKSVSLKFYDHFRVGARIDHLCSTLHSSPNHFTELEGFQTDQREILEKLGMAVTKEPVALQAKGAFRSRYSTHRERKLTK